MAVDTNSEVFANRSSKSPVTTGSQANNYIKLFEIDDRDRYMVKLKSAGEAVIFAGCYSHERGGK